MRRAFWRVQVRNSRRRVAGHSGDAVMQQRLLECIGVLLARQHLVHQLGVCRITIGLAPDTRVDHVPGDFQGTGA